MRRLTRCFDVQASGTLCVLDVDLPEIEHMPQFEAVVAGRGFEIKKKEISATRRRKLYMHHIHAVVLRIIGEVFATLPPCQRVVLSGYSQRADRQTGQVRDEYLISVGVDRSTWRQIDFTSLAAIDPVAAGPIRVAPRYEQDWHVQGNRAPDLGNRAVREAARILCALS